MSKNVDRLVALEGELAAHEGGLINGLHAFALLPSGKILAQEKFELGTRTVVIDPTQDTEWEREVERLKDLNEYRTLLGTVSEEEFQEYLRRVGIQNKAVEYSDDQPRDASGKWTDAEFTEASSGHDSYLKSHPELSNKGAGYTYDPETKRHYDAFSEDDRRTMLSKFTSGKEDLYIIANTNSSQGQAMTAQSYREAKAAGGGRAFIGGYTRDNGQKDTDSSFAKVGITDSQAKELGKQFKQESVLKISKNAKAKPEFIYSDT